MIVTNFGDKVVFKEKTGAKQPRANTQRQNEGCFAATPKTAKRQRPSRQAQHFSHIILVDFE
jgi:hypothetical protein